MDQRNGNGSFVPRTISSRSLMDMYRNNVYQSVESSFSRLSVSHDHVRPSPPEFFSEELYDMWDPNRPLPAQDWMQNDVASTYASSGLQRYLHYQTSPGFGDRFLERSYSDPYLALNPRELVFNQNRIGSREVSQPDSGRIPAANGLILGAHNYLTFNLYDEDPHSQQGASVSPTLENVRGRVVRLAKNENCCKSLSSALCSFTESGIETVFLELIDHVCELIVHPFGNCVIQKLVERCTEDQLTRILLKLTENEFQFVNICLDLHGIRPVQNLLFYVSPQQESIVTTALRPGVVDLIKDSNGHRVINHCFKYFTYEGIKNILPEMADNCFEIATDKSGCCILQLCVERSQGEYRDRLVAEITAIAPLLAEDPFGNYVVQHLLGLKVPQITAKLLKHLRGSYVALSQNKYGSNVVERCLMESTEEQSTRIILELLHNPYASMLLVDQFGNFVIQSALSVSKGKVHRGLRELIRRNIPTMCCNMYGKKVLSWFEKNNLPYM